MKTFKKIVLALAACAAALTVSACKDDIDESTYSFSMLGSLNFDVPAFVGIGDKYTLVPSGLRRTAQDLSDDILGYGFGYYWTVDILSTDNDTTKFETDLTGDGSYTFVVPDTLCTMTITCNAYAGGYYTSSNAQSSTIVNPTKDSGSLTGRGITEGLDSFTDARDGKSYYYTTIGGTDWMAENLAYAEGGHSYYECNIVDQVFGTFYTWNEAKNACPEGWRLPSNQDWLEAAEVYCPDADFNTNDTYENVAGAMMADAYFNANKMWEFWPDVPITNKSRMSIIPSGYAIIKEGNYEFDAITEYALFWTSDELDEDKATYRYIYMMKPGIYLGYADKNNFATTVRCIR